MTVRVLLCAAFVAALLAAPPAQAQLAPEWDFCDSRMLGTPDDRIRNCTAIIESRQETQSNRVIAYTNRGNAWRVKGDLDRAIADHSEAIRLDPKYAGAYTNRGIAWRAKGDLDRAIADHTEAIRLDPKYAGAYTNRGIAWRAKGDLDRAIADHTEAIRLGPKLAPPYFNRGIAWRDKGEFDRALADYNQAIRLEPNANRHNNRGLVYLRLERLDDAIADFNAVLTIDPKSAAALYGRGIAKLRKGDAAGSKADIAAAMAMRADIAEEFKRYGVTP